MGIAFIRMAVLVPFGKNRTQPIHQLRVLCLARMPDIFTDTLRGEPLPAYGHLWIFPDLPHFL